jgi:hypothetical protein
MRHNIIVEGSRSYVTLSVEDWNKIVKLYDCVVAYEFVEYTLQVEKNIPTPPHFAKLQSAIATINEDIYKNENYFGI